ncbi:MAG: ribonuclease P protein component [Bacilli bacterium]|nr:ribonuclease P protein component [Bacilli bacterium]
MKVMNRVKSKQEFHELCHSKTFEKNSHFVICYKKNNLGYTRVGISASSKLGNAVTRVRIRRQVRAMFTGLWNLEIPLDLVIIVRQNYNIENFSKDQQQLASLLDIIRRKINE